MKILFHYCFIILVIKQLVNVVKTCKCLSATIEDKYCRSDWGKLLNKNKQKHFNIF